MSLTQLDHVNVRTAQLENMKKFYQDILGMRAGPRPNFPFDGAWMYLNGKPVVHLVGIDRPVQDTAGASADKDTSLQLEHFAFAAEGQLTDFARQLNQQGVAYEILDPPGAGLSQLHLHDPDGNHIHIDFQLAAQN